MSYDPKVWDCGDVQVPELEDTFRRVVDENVAEALKEFVEGSEPWIRDGERGSAPLVGVYISGCDALEISSRRRTILSMVKEWVDTWAGSGGKIPNDKDRPMSDALLADLHASVAYLETALR